jgi:hypothetical protein
VADEAFGQQPPLDPKNSCSFSTLLGHTLQALLDRADKVLFWLARRGEKGLKAHHALALLAALLTAPALFGGLALDDHVLAVGARAPGSVPGLSAAPMSLFRFTSGRVADNQALIDQGVLLPWWSDLGHKNAFLRPLSSLTHLVDFQLYPDAPWLMHLHSLLWMVALVLVVAHVIARLESSETALGPFVTPAAGLAVLLFAIDDAHGMTVGWIANRNALIAATLTLPALSAHHRFVAHGWAKGRLLGPACFALGLCAGETALAVLGYLLAHALVLDRGSLARRALHLVPYGVIFVGWRVVFGALGLGSAGSGAYHDPFGEPLGYAQALALHLPLLIGSQLGVPVADLWFWGEPALQAFLLGVGALGALGVLGLAHRLLAANTLARFWMLGMLLSACAVAASAPSERLLLVPSVGGAALLAHLVLALRAGVNGSAQGGASTALPLGVMKLALIGLVLVHGPVSLVALPVRAASMQVLSNAIAAVDASIARSPDITDKSVLVVNAPFDTLLSYVQVARAASGVPRPAHLQWLGTASSALEVTRIAERTLRVRPEHGYLGSTPERHYRGEPRSLGLGARVEHPAFTARVVSLTEDGRPAAVDFELKRAIDDPALVLLQHARGRLERFTPPPVGHSVLFPAERFVDILAGRSSQPARVLEGGRSAD